MREMRFDRLLRATQLDYIFFSFQEHNVNGFENISVWDQDVKCHNEYINADSWLLYCEVTFGFLTSCVMFMGQFLP